MKKNNKMLPLTMDVTGSAFGANLSASDRASAIEIWWWEWSCSGEGDMEEERGESFRSSFGAVWKLTTREMVSSKKMNAKCSVMSD